MTMKERIYNGLFCLGLLLLLILVSTLGASGVIPM